MMINGKTENMRYFTKNAKYHNKQSEIEKIDDKDLLNIIMRGKHMWPNQQKRWEARLKRAQIKATKNAQSSMSLPNNALKHPQKQHDRV